MQNLSFKIQIAMLVSLLVAGLVAAFSWTVATRERSMILSEVLHRVVLQGRNLALSSAKPLLHEDPEFELHPLVAKVIEYDHDVVSIVVVDHNSVIKGHRDVAAIDKVYIPLKELRPIDQVTHQSAGETFRENESFIEVSVPVTDRRERIGTVYLQYSKRGIREAMDTIKGRILRIGLFALAVGVLLSLLLAFHITSPISKLTRGAESIGRGNLDTRIKIRSVKEIQALAHTFNEMARSLEESHRAMLDKERMEKELEIAREIQETLLPAHLPHLRNFEIDAYYHPASQVGGDYFDLIRVDERHLMIVVGDVAGKGVPGLVIMAMARILVRHLALKGERPSKLLRHLNVLLKRDMKRNLFLTLFCGLLDTHDGTLRFASAAHMPLIVYHSNEQMVRMMSTKARPVGIFSDEVFSQGLEEYVVCLQPGDLLLQFTDGLNEMRDPAGNEFGIERIMQTAYDEAKGGARHLIAEIKRRLGEFRHGELQSDDLTLLAVSALPAGMERVNEERMEILDRVVFD
ncbi:MAG TPA: SpoIIE family protein phosphatase [Patescibacteria group bacterium]|nr:SpoIIE family protein phosphatase [Patescibacteria group bacterium]